MFEMKHDGNGDDHHGGKTNHTRCTQYRFFFECVADHKLLAQRRRGRRTRAMYKACPAMPAPSPAQMMMVAVILTKICQNLANRKQHSLATSWTLTRSTRF